MHVIYLNLKKLIEDFDPIYLYVRKIHSQK